MRFLLALGLVAAACAPAQPISRTTPTETATPPAEPAGATATASPTPSEKGVPQPAYLTIELTDVRSGERFTLGQFAGSVTIVQGMAVW